MTERVRVEIEGESGDLQRAALAAKAAIKGVGDEARKQDRHLAVSTRAVNSHTRALDSSTRSAVSYGRALGSANRQATFLRNTIALIKWPAFITGAGLATQAVSALTAGVVALSGALVPATGSLAAMPAVASAAVQGIGTLKLATGGLKEAVGGLNEGIDYQGKAWRALSKDGQRFARTLAGLKPEIRELQRTAQRGFFPGAEDGIERAVRNLPELRRQVEGTSRTLGSLARKGGAWLGQDAVGRDITRQGERNRVTIQRLGHSGLYLADAFRHIVIEAGPLVDWLTKSTVHFTRMIDRQAKAGRESGKMRNFFRETREVMQSLANIGGDLAHVFWEVAKAGKANLGDDMLKALEKGAQHLRDWSDSTKGQNQLAQYFKDAKPAVFEMGRLARDVALAFLKLGNQQGVAELIRQIRVDLLPVLVKVVGTTTKAFGPHLIDLLVNAAELFGDLAGSTGPLVSFVDILSVGAEVLHTLLTDVPGLKVMVVTLAAAASVLKAVNLTAKITGVKRLADAYKGLAVAADSAAAAESGTRSIPARGGGLPGLSLPGGRAAGVPPPPPPPRGPGRAPFNAYQSTLESLPPTMANSAYGRKYALDQARKAGQEQLAAVAASRPAIEREGAKAGAGWRKAFVGKLGGMRNQLSGLLANAAASAPLTTYGAAIAAAGASQYGAGAAIRATGAPGWMRDLAALNAGPAAFAGSRSTKTAGSLIKDYVPDLKALDAAAKSLNTTKIRKAGDDLRALYDAAKKKAGGKLAPELDAEFQAMIKKADELGGSLDRLRSNFSRMRKGSVLSVGELRDNIDQNFDFMATQMDVRSAKGASAVTLNTKLAVRSVKRFMRDGSLTTREGMREIQRIFEKTMELYGITGNQASHDAEARAYHVVTGNDTHATNATHGNARGGLHQIGKPGERGRDTIPMQIGGQKVMVGSGEVAAVLNRDQQQALNERLADVGGLPGFFRRSWRPHYMATGGMVGALAGARSFQGDGGWRGVAPNGINAAIKSIALWAMRNFGATATSTVRGDSTTFHSPGRRAAVDLVSGNMLAMARGIDSAFRPRLAELIHTPLGYSVKNGQKVSPFAQADHYDHVHAAALGQALAAAGMAPAEIKRLLVKGPRSPLRSIIQANLDLTRDAANRRLAELTQAAGGTGIETEGLPEDVRGAVESIAEARGWNAADWLWIINRESGGRAVRNPTSTAFGVGQLLDYNQARYGGGPGSSLAEQVAAMAGYIGDRYGNPSNARRFWEANGWYARGGIVEAARGLFGGAFGRTAPTGTGSTRQPTTSGPRLRPRVRRATRAALRALRRPSKRVRALAARTPRALGTGWDNAWNALDKRREGADKTLEHVLGPARARLREQTTVDHDDNLDTPDILNEAGITLPDGKFVPGIKQAVDMLNEQIGNREFVERTLKDQAAVAQAALATIAQQLAARRKLWEQMLEKIKKQAARIKTIKTRLKVLDKKKKPSKADKAEQKRLEAELVGLRASQKLLTGVENGEPSITDRSWKEENPDSPAGRAYAAIGAAEASREDWRAKAEQLPWDLIQVGNQIKDLRLEIEEISGTKPPKTTANPNDDVLKDLQLEQLRGINANLMLQLAQQGVFNNFTPTLVGGLGGFAKGTWRVANTGLAIVHKDEAILSDPQGPHGSQFGGYANQIPVRGGDSPQINITLVQDPTGLVRVVDARIDGKMAKVNATTGRDSRQYSVAPGR